MRVQRVKHWCQPTVAVVRDLDPERNQWHAWRSPVNCQLAVSIPLAAKHQSWVYDWMRCMKSQPVSHTTQDNNCYERATKIRGLVSSNSTVSTERISSWRAWPPVVQNGDGPVADAGARDLRDQLHEKTQRSLCLKNISRENASSTQKQLVCCNRPSIRVT